jgi:hypothetical protein
MVYDNWLGDIAKRFQVEFDAIKTTHNFDYGDEFEVAVATVLREVLPLRFGVCRGYVVARNGQRAGDDIIIFDAQRFPTLRALERTDLSRKENVPAEAVLAYLEAKHTLHLKGDGGQSLSKAIMQVRQIKSVPRTRVPLNQLAQGINIAAPLTINFGPGWPTFRNPYYSAIWARHVDSDNMNAIGSAVELSTDVRQTSPDALVAGNWLMLPVHHVEDGQRVTCPFMFDGCLWVIGQVPTAPWGAALAHLLWAIEWVQLGPLPWSEMLQEQVPQSNEVYRVKPPVSDSGGNDPKT